MGLLLPLMGKGRQTLVLYHGQKHSNPSPTPFPCYGCWWYYRLRGYYSPQLCGPRKEGGKLYWISFDDPDQRSLSSCGVSQPSPHPAAVRHGLDSYPSTAWDRHGVGCHSDTCLVLSPSTVDNREHPRIPGKAGPLWPHCQGTARKEQKNTLSCLQCLLFSRTGIQGCPQPRLYTTQLQRVPFT